MTDVYKNIGSRDQEWARKTREDGTQVNIADLLLILISMWL